MMIQYFVNGCCATAFTVVEGKKMPDQARPGFDTGQTKQKKSGIHQTVKSLTGVNFNRASVW
jgi:hypothetical protein